MDFQILLANLTNPTILFFLLGILATVIKSDLEIPESSSKFISLYLLFAIGFKGGQELAHTKLEIEIFYSILFGLGIASIIPIYTFFILKQKVSISNAGAIAATYGSVSVVTFVSAVTFLELQQLTFSGHMVAVMAFMESPSIIVGVLLMAYFDKNNKNSNLVPMLKHSLTNGSVLLIFGSLVIGFVADSKQAQGIQHFTTDIFKGFLSIFLLEMGMVTARRFGAFKKHGIFLSAFAIIIPIINGCLIAYLSSCVTSDVGNRFIFAILAASASYIAVPAALKLTAPNADPGIYIPMALGVTFPFNISIGMPLYLSIVINS
ncbi:MAG: sodium-dependent bicarbonate transport family permease [Solirubrobacteraceae bacterium]